MILDLPRVRAILSRRATLDRSIDIQNLQASRGRFSFLVTSVRWRPSSSVPQVGANVGAYQSPNPKNRISSISYAKLMADGVGFEPTRPFRAYRSSRPVPSTA